ncbi:hypothetical protein FRB99_002163 [Tulasnella sp. 403]|nr:hypothetical protein FRB99_002163 [Tulasnella sp. 403]
MSTAHTTKEALVKQWTDEQLSLSKQLIFRDHDLSFTVSIGNGASESDITPGSECGSDRDVPTVRTESIPKIQIAGLKYVGGLDISYLEGDVSEVDEPDAGIRGEGNPETELPKPDAYASLVVLSFPSLDVLHEVTEPVYHTYTPYIPSFLSYREAPTYLSLLDSLRSRLKEEGKEDEFPQILFVDGNGRLHVREAGSACIVGLKSGIPTVGIAKNYHPPHAGSTQDVTALEEEDKSEWRHTQSGMRKVAQSVLTKPGTWFGLFGTDTVSETYIGAALAQPGKAKNPIFVSPGHKISLLTAIRVTLALSRSRVPEPTRMADIRSRQAIRDAAVGSKG